jgi:hypothetical protein
MFYICHMWRMFCLMRVHLCRVFFNEAWLNLVQYKVQVKLNFKVASFTMNTKFRYLKGPNSIPTVKILLKINNQEPICQHDDSGLFEGGRRGNCRTEVYAG